MQEDLSSYTHYKPLTGPIADYINEHYNELKADFFDNISKSQLVASKPGYKFLDGVTDLYKGKILSAALKLSTIALDDDERRIMNWGLDEKYRYTYKRVNPELRGPCVEFVEKFDDMLEQCFFNIAFPGASITPHLGITSTYFRTHICLQENQGFVFDIEGEKKHWHEGPQNLFTFDDANVRHGVSYEDKGEIKPRILLILDIKKSYYPELWK
jgi:hypothetical protein